MTEANIVHTTAAPRTRESLAADLRMLGIVPGETLLVHSSLKALGWVNGAETAVIQALYDVITPEGTLVMPAMSPDLTDPAHWRAPPIPQAWHEAVRQSMPTFDLRRTPSRGMGRIAELFRTWPGVLRSDHPTSSLVAWGAQAGRILRDHPLEDPFGEASPLARLYDLEARVLLLGVTFESCTILHLAERRAWPRQALIQEGAPLIVAGERRWVRYGTPILRVDLLADAGRHLVETGIARGGTVGSAAVHLLPVRETVDSTVARWQQMGLTGE
ncbi:AAC(3) family N-acetyltransferase [Labrys okinawensis]|uniref:Aminoglycoside N(3)-acetyltransferase n=1 Tax=Labrys okinawensis TaxID=346911 RepID=A0A2S9QCY0_9HYPH|nr:AAC(3) family N-acetyltransferase [Labrys okinawensis]PRH87170.1 AAC(3) family N-acetyltransferase [Labrys okinawensis]